MAVPTIDELLTVREYLASSFEFDCDYVDGRLEERFLGEYDHAKLQSLFDRWFSAHEEEWAIDVLVELRVQVAPTRFRVPDLCILRREAPTDQIVRTAPLICIEILSPEDTLSRLEVKVEDYLRMGVGHVWVVNPASRVGWECSTRGWNHPADRRFSVPGTDIYVSLEEIFRALDMAHRGGRLPSGA
jgi:Uma2 family endonuclease